MDWDALSEVEQRIHHAITTNPVSCSICRQVHRQAQNAARVVTQLRCDALRDYEQKTSARCWRLTRNCGFTVASRTFFELFPFYRQPHESERLYVQRLYKYRKALVSSGSNTIDQIIRTLIGITKDETFPISSNGNESGQARSST